VAILLLCDLVMMNLSLLALFFLHFNPDKTIRSEVVNLVILLYPPIVINCFPEI